MAEFPKVAIIGRPNVGKSTLFNRLIGQRKAITNDMPGVTRDLIYGETLWGGRDITLIDTGGYDLSATDEMGRSVLENVREALAQAHAAIFVVDGMAGPAGGDYEILDMLRQRDIPTVLAVNKIDHISHDPYSADFYSFGIDPLIPISSAHGHGSGDLLDAVLELIPPAEELEAVEEGEEPIRVAIVGRPNVGKSTLLNALSGQQRSLVTSVAGTTRDPVDTRVSWQGRDFLLVDTAGIRRQGKIDNEVERFSVLRAQRAIERCDVVLLIIDGVEGVTESDARVFSMADEMGKAVVLCVNKWDAVEKQTGTAEACTEQIREVLRFLRRAPLLYISAQSGQRVQKIFPLIEKVYESYTRRVPTGELNRFLEDLLERRPALYKGKTPHIQYMTQAMTKPPTFILFCRDPRFLPENWKRYLLNQIYETWDFEGAPLVLRVRHTARKGAHGEAM